MKTILSIQGLPLIIIGLIYLGTFPRITTEVSVIVGVEDRCAAKIKPHGCGS